MASSDTIHRILEKIEVTGADAAARAMAALGKAFEDPAKKLGMLKDKMKEAFGKPEAFIKDLPTGEKLVKSFKNWKEVLADFSAEKLSIPTTLNGWLEKSWKVNEELEVMRDRLIGVQLAADQMSKVQPVKGYDRVEEAIKGAGIAFKKMEEIAYDTATPVERIGEGYEKLRPLLGGMGKNQKDLFELTENSAAAAKVFGSNIENVSSKMQDLLIRGKSRDIHDPFGLALAAEAGIKKTDSYKTRIEKAESALKKLAAPIKEVTKNTGAALERWKILTDGILRETTQPIFESIGRLVQRWDDWLKQDEDAILRVANAAGDAWKIFADMTDTAWKFTTGLMDTLQITSALTAGWDMFMDGVEAALTAIDSMSQGFKVLGHLWDYITGKDGFQKLGASMDGLYLKLMRFGEAMVKFILRPIKWIEDEVEKLKKVIPASWTGKDKFVGPEKPTKGGVETIENAMAKQIEEWTKRVAKEEKAAGIKDEESAIRRHGLSKEDLEGFFKKALGGKKPLINIEEVNIQQNFRDQDPDAVLVELTRGFERLSEAALQSTTGGTATVYGGGGSYGG